MSMIAKNAKAIFLEAVEKHSPNEWPSFLDRACRDDDKLRQRVEGLLQAHQEKDSLFDVEPTADIERVTEEIGEMIGPYKLLQQVGEGGMGVVYMAEQTEPVKRRVALKIIKPGMDSRQMMARFEAERQALALMDHPNIAKVLDAATTRSGRPYFVMELVKGVPITQYCDEQHLAPNERLALFVPICQAVQHAHQKGIIHRDLKPSNVLVALYDGQPVPKVIDFGVAKATSQQLTEKTMFTQLGQVVGTLEYMSPEQAQVNQLDVDTRSDVYSLGVLLYELLTGATPFDKHRLRSAAFDEMLRIIRDEEPPRPSVRLSTIDTLPSVAANRRIEPKKLRTLVRGELDWIVMKALEKDRARRYETAQGFADDVQRYMNQEAVQACPPSMMYQIRKFVRRHRGPVAAGISLILMLLAGVAGTATGWMNAVEQKRDAITARDEARAAKRLAEEARDRESRIRREAELNRYVSDVGLAHQTLDDGNLVRAEELLRQHIPNSPDESDLRSYEWYLLWQRCQGDALFSFPEQRHQVRSLAVSPSGNFVATTSMDDVKDPFSGNQAISGELVLYSTEPNERVATLRQGVNPAECAVFSPDDKLLITGNLDGSLDLWSGKRFGELRRLEAVHQSAVSAITFSPRHNQFATGDANGQVILWSYPDVTVVHRFETLGIHISTLAFNQSGSTLAAASGYAGRVALFNTADKRSREFGLKATWVNSIAFSPIADDLLAIAAVDSSIRFLDISTGRESVVGRHLGQVNSIAFLPDGETLVTASEDSTIRLWDRKTSEEKGMLIGHRGNIARATPSTDGRIYSAGSDKTLRVWSSQPRADELKDDGMGWVRAVDFSNDGKWLATGSADGNVRLWDLASRRIVHTYPAFVNHEHTWVCGMVFHPTKDILLVGNEAGEIQFWDVGTGEMKRTIQAHDSGDLWRLGVSPDGKYLVSTTGRYPPYRAAGEMKIWDYGTLQQNVDPVVTTVPLETAVQTFTFSPKQRILVTCGADGVALWDLDSGTKVTHVTDQEGAGVAVSSDGQLLATTGGGSVTTLWDLSDPKHCVQKGRFEGARGERIAFTRDGRTLVTVGKGHTLRLFNVETQRELVVLQGHTTFIQDLCLSPDEGTLASASADYTVRLWPGTRP